MLEQARRPHGIRKRWLTPARWTRPRWLRWLACRPTLGDPKAFEKFMTIERVVDDEIDGAAVVVCHHEVDLLAFVSSPNSSS